MTPARHHDLAPRTLGGGLAAGLLAMGALFAARPQPASQVFGLPTSGSGLSYVRALAFRDFAIAASLALAAAAGPRKALGLLAASLAVIPASDAALVASRRGAGAAPSLVLHAASAAGLATLAFLCLRPARRTLAREP